MTLSRFLRDYIYIPLGGNRKGNARTYINLLSTFLIGGLWHGAGWTFIIWGALHGIALAIHRLWQSLGFKMNKILAWFITFNFINITWIFFRAKDFESAIKVLGSMFSLDLEFNTNILKILIIMIGLLIVLSFKNSMEFFKTKFKFTIFQIILTTTFLFLSFLAIRLGKSSEFLYFNF